MKPEQCFRNHRLLALAITLAVSINAQAQEAPPPANFPPPGNANLGAGRGGGRGGGAWANYVLGSTYAQARAAQEALIASGRTPLTPDQQTSIAEMNSSLGTLNQALTEARNALAAAVFAGAPDDAKINSKADALTKAELDLATARAGAFAKIQTSGNKLSAGQIENLLQQQQQPGGRGGGAGGDFQSAILAGADFSPKAPIQVRTPEDEVKSMTLPPGYRLTPVLWDPYIQEPTQIAFDGNGRLFVSEMRSYMQDPADNSVRQAISRISMHEDLNNDGVYDWRDRHTVFVDGLVATRYVMPLGINRVVALEYDKPDAYIYTDTDNDGVADKKELFAANVGQVGGNVEHQNSGLTWALDNWLYATLSPFRLRWTPTGVIREASGSPRGQWGITMDNYGKIFSQEGASGVPAYFQLPIHYGTFEPNSPLAGLAPGFNITRGAPTIGDMQGGMADIRLPDYSLRSGTAAAGNDVFRGDRLPADMIGDYFYGETVARIVRRIRPVVTEGLTQLRNVYSDTEFMKSTDPLFRPVDMTTAPDGTLYITDMYRGIIQESNWTGPGTYARAKIEQYGLDRIVSHGRIFRLTYDGMDRDTTQPNMGHDTSAQLVAHLQHPNGWWRDAAQQNLIVRQDKSAVPALQNMARTSGSQLGRIHALWTLEGLGALDAAIVREQLKSADPKIKIQAARLAETLIKAGDASLIADVKELSKDAVPDVVIQAMLSVGHVQGTNAMPFVQTTMASSQSPGVAAIGSQLVANGGQGGRGRRGGGGGGFPGGAGRGGRGGRGGPLPGQIAPGTP